MKRNKNAKSGFAKHYKLKVHYFKFPKRKKKRRNMGKTDCEECADPSEIVIPLLLF